MTRKPDRLDLFRTLSGYYLGNILSDFQRSGLLMELEEWQSATRLAKKFAYDEELLIAVFAFIYETTDILDHRGKDTYRVSEHYPNYYSLGFQLDKFVLSYGPTVEKLTQSLKSKDLGRRFVDRKAEAHAYNYIESQPNPIVVQLVKELSIHSLVDLGSGPGTTLSELASRDKRFYGWGVDESIDMCEQASKRFQRMGLDSRLKVIHARAQELGTSMPLRTRQRIESVHCKGLLNELFRGGSSQAVAYMKKLKQLFPGKLVFVVDYYGKLTHESNVFNGYSHTLIHDLIQALTCQGIPPPNIDGWVAVYEKADCKLRHAFEGDSKGIEWFVHLVDL